MSIGLQGRFPDQTQTVHFFPSHIRKANILMSPKDTTEAVVTQSQLAEALQAMVAHTQVIAANQPKARKPINAPVPTAFNKTGIPRPMPVVVYQNGRQVDEATITDAELALLPKLRPGRFINRLVTVRRDTSKPEPTFHIEYSNASADKRTMLKDEFRNFLELLTRLTTEEPISAQ